MRMQFIVSSSLLSQQLVAVSGVINRNPIVPILENVLLEISQNILRITASDFRTSIHTSIEIDSDIQVTIAIPARILLETVKNLPDQLLTLVINPDSYTVVIESENGNYKLAGENANDFPRLKLSEKGRNELYLATQTQKNILQKVLFATSHDELKPAMSGLYMHIEKEKATFVATDGHRLVRYIQQISEVSLHASMVIPKKALILLNGLLQARKEDLLVAFDQSKIQFTLGQLHIITRLIDERYPDYENVIPKDHTKKLVIHRPALVSALKRSSIYANKATHQVKISIQNEQLTLSAEDFDFSNQARESLLCAYEGTPIEIAFNAKLLLEMLVTLSTEEVTLLFGEPNRAVLLLPKGTDDKETLLLLIMPIIF